MMACFGSSRGPVQGQHELGQNTCATHAGISDHLWSYAWNRNILRESCVETQICFTSTTNVVRKSVCPSPRQSVIIFPVVVVLPAAGRICICSPCPALSDTALRHCEISSSGALVLWSVALSPSPAGTLVSRVLLHQAAFVSAPCQTPNSSCPPPRLSARPTMLASTCRATLVKAFPSSVRVSLSPRVPRCV